MKYMSKKKKKKKKTGNFWDIEMPYIHVERPLYCEEDEEITNPQIPLSGHDRFPQAEDDLGVEDFYPQAEDDPSSITASLIKRAEEDPDFDPLS